ncbi:OLC1v1034138C2 [Oldenlandia corymbosa var. corymbosa]|uniref:OLC1v1034138C2 n=1 Tax=Oldenlandia corymbosa var. corymbosa TaxID=529605 RepID=A0AAV1CPT9_OLDCO|nr:OLC1v1034138C2 [Oldenlandia corymbosa var. corymbosa]
MSLKLPHQKLVSASCPDPWLSIKPTRIYAVSSKVVGLNHLRLHQRYGKKRHRLRLSLLDDCNLSFSCGISNCKKPSVIFCKFRRNKFLIPRASADEGVTVNGSPRASTSSEGGGMRVKLDEPLQAEDNSIGLVQLLYDAARVFELALREQSSLSKISWFSTAWIGVDKTAWIKELSYQASVYSLLKAACEISSRGERRDRDINVFVQRSLSRQSAPLETVINEKLSVKQPEVYDWFWTNQVPGAVTNFVNYFEKDQRFAAATSVFGVSGNSSDLSLLILALSCIAAITKLGPTKISCPQFFSIFSDTTGRLMDMLVEFVPIRKAYESVKDIGLRREFLVHFGPRAATCRVNRDGCTEEVIFWVGFVQKQLQKAIDRERIWSKLTTSESIEVLERDLAIIGFFTALGRSTQAFLSANGFKSTDGPIEALIRYLIGGGVLFYPQLSSISSYQLYVEVVSEELDWLPFYPGSSRTLSQSFGHKKTEEIPPNPEAIAIVLDVCSHWISSFIKYSKWLENPSNIKAANFLSKGHQKLKMCVEELGMEMSKSGTYTPAERENPDSFNKALESVEEALRRLEGLLQELHVSSSSGKEQLQAACSDLERIRRIKKEAEFLEASFRAKEASLQRVIPKPDFLSFFCMRLLFSGLFLNLVFFLSFLWWYFYFMSCFCGLGVRVTTCLP